jgi:hypothetical protein
MSEIGDLTPSSADFLAEVARIRASGTLGRSTQMLRLFDFLVDCQAQGRKPKEMEVAIDGFGRGADFDAGQDAMVRVHAHKLRRRLEDYYRSEAPALYRLTIPRGEYQLSFSAAAKDTDPVPGAVPLPQRSGLARLLPTTTRERIAAAICLGLAALCLVFIAREFMRPKLDERLAAVHASALWTPLLQDDLPIQLVLGDYYIFGERDQRAGIRRLIRDFDVNSRQDLEQRFVADPAQAARFADLNLGYLPTSSAAALRAVLPVVMSMGKPVNLTLASELDPSTIKSTHIVYIGYLSALGMLQDIAFAGSRYSFGGSFDELVDHESGQAYVSEAGEPHAQTQRYRDYAYLSSFAGPGGAQHLIVAGTRDTALMQSAEIVADPAQLAAISAGAGKSPAFEALYEVHGVNGVNIESRLIAAAPLDAQAIMHDVGERPE